MDIVADLSKEELKKGFTPYILNNNNYTNIGNYGHSWVYNPIPKCKNLHLSNNYSSSRLFMRISIECF